MTVKLSKESKEGNVADKGNEYSGGRGTAGINGELPSSVLIMFRDIPGGTLLGKSVGMEPLFEPRGVIVLLASPTESNNSSSHGLIKFTGYTALTKISFRN